MNYSAVVNKIREAVASLPGDIRFIHGARIDGSLFTSGDAFPQIHLYPFTSTVDITNAFYERCDMVIAFWMQDKPDSSVEEREQIISEMDVLSKQFLIALDNEVSGRISNIRREPQYRQLQGTVSGYAITFTIEVASGKC